MSSIKTDKTPYKVRVKERSRQYRIEVKAWLDELKNKPCHDCKQTFHPCQMDFDHVEDGKEFDIAAAPCMSRKRIQRELEKCELVCANCHRLRTHKRKITEG